MMRLSVKPPAPTPLNIGLMFVLPDGRLNLEKMAVVARTRAVTHERKYESIRDAILGEMDGVAAQAKAELAVYADRARAELLALSREMAGE